MNKQVEQIKSEIERLKKWCEEHTTESYSCYFDAFNDIDIFINSLEEEPVSEDLEQAAVEAFKHIVDSDKNNFYEIFKAGANWQKEQMMKGAITTFVFEDRLAGSPKVSVELPYPKYEFGDKVKVIIVKEE